MNQVAETCLVLILYEMQNELLPTGENR